VAQWQNGSASAWKETAQPPTKWYGAMRRIVSGADKPRFENEIRTQTRNKNTNSNNQTLKNK
jgi:hypothetical protein